MRRYLVSQLAVPRQVPLLGFCYSFAWPIGAKSCILKVLYFMRTDSGPS